MRRCRNCKYYEPCTCMLFDTPIKPEQASCFCWESGKIRIVPVGGGVTICYIKDNTK